MAMATDARTGHVAILTGGTMLIVGGACAEVDRQLFALHEHHQCCSEVTMQWRAVTSVVALALTPAAIPVPASHLLQDLASCATGLLPTLTLTSRWVLLASVCHAFILQARCPSLVAAITAALAADGGKLKVPRLASPVAYRAFVDYIYTGNPMAQLEPEDLLCGAVREQLMACASLSLDKLKERMQQQVSSQSRFYSG